MKIPKSPVSAVQRQVLVQAGGCSERHERPWRPPWWAPEEQAARNWAQSEAAGPAREANSLSNLNVEVHNRTLC